MEHGHGLLTDISLGIIFAVVLSHIARLLKQPLILGYVAGGVLLGANIGFGLVTERANIETISEIGLIFLLFIIGLEINIRELMRMGRSIITLGVAQFLLNALLGFAVYSLLSALPIFATDGPFDRIYLAVASSISSTLIVVKLLQDKFEMKGLPGRLTLGVLVFQDIWAILFMGLQPNLADPQPLQIAGSIGAGIFLVIMSFLISRYFLSALFHASSKRPELILLTSIAWCFAVSAGAQYLGLSLEMGALVAGVSIAAFPYGHDVISKLSGIRDFFVTLFFVALGMQIPLPDLATVQLALIIVVFVMVSRVLIIAPIVTLLGEGLRPGFVTSLNLAQVSEFSLVILALGAGYQHVSEQVSHAVLTAMIMTSIISPYIISFNNELGRALLGVATKLGWKEFDNEPAAGDSTHETGREIVLLGHFRITQSLLELILASAPELKDRLSIVDFNAAVGRTTRELGFHWHYGDLSHPESLEHAGIEHAKTIICTISDTFLKGTSTSRLLFLLKRMAPQAKIIMMAEDSKDENTLLEQGADHIIVPARVTAEHLLELLTDQDDKEKTERRSLRNFFRK